MGNTTDHIFDTHNWQFVSKPSTYDIVRDQRTGIHAQKHVIPNNPTISQKDQMQVYRYRNLTNKPIVKVYDAEYAKNKSSGACGAAKDIVVHSQYIPHRLSDTRNLNHGQALYVLSQALAGFHQLHHRFGPFQITDDHIGFNQIGQTKVWHSPNFATNHLDRESIVLMSTVNPKNFDQRMEKRQQQEMVEDIWMAVDQHANISPQFTNKANYFRERNFVQARKMVADQIARGITYVPQYLNFNDNNNQNSTVHQFATQSRVQNVNINPNTTQSNAFMLNQTTGTQPYRTTTQSIPNQAGTTVQMSSTQPLPNNQVYQTTYVNPSVRQATAINQLSPYITQSYLPNQPASNQLGPNQFTPTVMQQTYQQQNIAVDPRYQTSMVYNYNPNVTNSNIVSNQPRISSY